MPVGLTGTARPAVVSEIMSSPVQTCLLGVTAGMAAEKMRAAGIMHLVVVDDSGRVVGVLSDRDIRAAQPSLLLVRDAALRDKALSLLKVADIMSSSTHTVHPDSTVRAALTLMKRHKVGSIPVIDDEGRPVGIVTHGNVVNLALSLLSGLESPTRPRATVSRG